MRNRESGRLPGWSAMFTAHDSRRGTPGQLVGGTVDVQVSGDVTERVPTVNSVSSFCYREHAGSKHVYSEFFGTRAISDSACNDASDSRIVRVKEGLNVQVRCTGSRIGDHLA